MARWRSRASESLGARTLRRRRLRPGTAEEGVGMPRQRRREEEEAEEEEEEEAEEEEEEPPRPRGVRCKEPGLHPTCRGEFQSQAGLAVEKHAASLRSCNALPAGPRKLHKWLKRAGENGPPCKCALLCTKEHRMPTFVAGFGKHTPPSHTFL
ncbi:unnamed protein product, partial [Prorocentrum cordatum]